MRVGEEANDVTSVNTVLQQCTGSSDGAMQFRQSGY